MQLALAAFLAMLSSATSLQKTSQYPMPSLLTQPAVQDGPSPLDVLIAANGDGDFMFSAE